MSSSPFRRWHVCPTATSGTAPDVEGQAGADFFTAAHGGTMLNVYDKSLFCHSQQSASPIQPESKIKLSSVERHRVLLTCRPQCAGFGLYICHPHHSKNSSEHILLTKCPMSFSTDFPYASLVLDNLWWTLVATLQQIPEVNKTLCKTDCEWAHWYRKLDQVALIHSWGWFSPINYRLKNVIVIKVLVRLPF